MKDMGAFGVASEAGDEETIHCLRKVIDTTTMHNKQFRSFSYGNKPFFYAEDGREAQEIEEGKFVFEDDTDLVFSVTEELRYQAAIRKPR